MLLGCRLLLHVTDDGQDVSAAFFDGQRRSRGQHRLDACRRVQAQQLPPGGNAFVNLLEKPRISHLVLHDALSILLRSAATHAGLLRRLLRAFPGGPSLTLEAVQLLQLDPALCIKVPNRRGPPFGLDTFEVAADRCLRDPQILGDRRL